MAAIIRAFFVFMAQNLQMFDVKAFTEKQLQHQFLFQKPISMISTELKANKERMQKKGNCAHHVSSGVYSMDFNDAHYLIDHKVHGISLMPGSQIINMAYDMLDMEGLNTAQCELIDLSFHKMISISDNPSLMGFMDDDKKTEKKIVIKDDSADSIFASMKVDVNQRQGNQLQTSNINVNDVIDRAEEKIEKEDFYEKLTHNGNTYGPAFQGVDVCWKTRDETLAVLSKLEVAEQINCLECIDTILLDAALHPLMASQNVINKTAILTGCRSFKLFQRDTLPAWSYVSNINYNADSSALAGDVTILSVDRRLVAVLQQVNFRLSDNTSGNAKPAKNIAVAGTFTCEPVQEALEFWGDTIGYQPDIEFAPYNQVFQQLLEHKSIFDRPDRDLNVILLNLEDWSNKSTKKQLNGGYRLPNDQEIAHINKYETRYLYDEIFVKKCYLKHGITIENGDTILDVGANIGMFSLFVNQHAQNTTIYAFEPAPHAFEALKINAALHGDHNIYPENVGISNERKEAEFTYYEKSSVFSSFNADHEEDSKAVRAVVTNMLKESGVTDDEELDQFADELMADRMKSRSFTCPLKSISDVIREKGLLQIDLLKIDAEKSEQQILLGIDDDDWEKIKQLVIEVHDSEGAVIRDIKQLLDEKGFEVEMEEEDLLHDSGLYNLFAVRKKPISNREYEHSNAILTETQTEQNIRADLKSFVSIVASKAENSSSPYLIVLCPPKPDSMLSYHFISEMENTITLQLADTPNVQVVKSSEITKTYPVEEYYNPHGDQLGHIPYTRNFYHALGTIIARKLDAYQRKAYKVIVLDCDQTLWKGVCGETGAEGVEISEHRKKLHNFMRDLKNRGFLLCLCSKNSEEDVMQVFEKNKDMVLTKDDLVSWKINWKPKSENIRELAEELDLGLDSFIFIDDNPVECAEVQAHCPEVLTLQLPAEENKIPHFLKHSWAFDNLNVTNEDSRRTSMYRQEMHRKEFRNKAETMESFLARLELDIKIRSLEESDIKRASQLTMRTNQFNFTTIRRSTAEIDQLLQSGKMEAMMCEVSDRFGDYGKVGFILYETTPFSLNVDTFLLSCRVLGRGVEHRILAELGRLAHKDDIKIVKIRFRQTPKNKPAWDFLKSVAGTYKKAVRDEFYEFLIPSEQAKNVIYNPGATPDEAKPEKSGKIHSTEIYQSEGHLKYIAEELNSADTIFEAIDAGRKRRERALESDYIPPVSELEKTISEIWKEVLGMERVGLHDNFSDLGGTSLMAVHVISKMRKAFNKDLSVISLYENPTVSMLTQMLESNGQAAEDKLQNIKESAIKRRTVLRGRNRKI